VKLCFCNVLYSKKNDRGGLGSHIQDLSQELAKSGHHVTILTSGEKKEYFEERVKIVQLAKVARYSSPWQFLDPFYWLQRFYYMWKLSTYVRRNRFDLVEAAEGGAEQLFLIFLRSCPVITKMHGNFRHIYNHNFLARLIEFLEWLVISRSDGVYTSSLAYAKTMALEYKIPLETVRIIPYGIRIKDLYDQKNNEDNSIAENSNCKTVLLSVGSSPIRKGATLFLEAASELANQKIQFLLASSHDRIQLPMQIPGNVTSIGNLERKQFYSVLSKADIVVFPSQFESFGISTYEAMLLGKIIIISKNVPLEGSARFYERCVVLENLTGKALANTIEDIFGEKIRIPTVNTGTLERMREEYDISNIAASTLAYYQHVLASRATNLRAVAQKSRA
jgi:1,4-alpha-glucan branching enzyme